MKTRISSEKELLKTINDNKYLCAHGVDESNLCNKCLEKQRNAEIRQYMHKYRKTAEENNEIYGDF